MTQTLVPSDCELLVIISFFQARVAYLSIHSCKCLPSPFWYWLWEITSAAPIPGNSNVQTDFHVGDSEYNLWVPYSWGSFHISFTVKWVPCLFIVQHSILTRVQQHASSCFIKHMYFSATDDMVLLQKPRACDISTDACHKVHIASFSTSELSNTIWYAGSSEWQKCLHCSMNLVPKPS